MEQAHYFISSVEAFLDSQRIFSRPRAMISPQGVFRAFEDSPEVRKLFLSGKNLKLIVDGQEMSARLIRESAREGTHYNLRLLPASTAVSDRLGEMVEKEGISSPWKRQYPRLLTKNFSTGVEVPMSVVFSRLIGKSAGAIVNFSVHGLMFHFPCVPGSIAESVDQKTHLQIITNRGNTIEAWVRVVRIFDDLISGKKMMRGLGVVLLNMPKKDRDFYNALILDACGEVKQI